MVWLRQLRGKAAARGTQPQHTAFTALKGQEPKVAAQGGTGRRKGTASLHLHFHFQRQVFKGRFLMAVYIFQFSAIQAVCQFFQPFRARGPFFAKRMVCCGADILEPIAFPAVQDVDG